jgi:hypothetical protein
MRILAASCGLVAVALLSGCARSRITTDIKANGSWARTVSLTGQEKKKEEMQMTPALEDIFLIPSGPGWKSHEEKKSGDRTIILERVMAAGATLKGDLSLKDDEKGKLKLVNEVTVTRAGPRRFEYRETLHWSGEPPKNIGANIKPEDIAEIKASLPKALATDENARSLAEKTAVLAIPLLFGPGDPLLAMGLMHPDLAERRASQRIGALLLKALEEQFGDKLQPDQRRAVARKLIEKTFSSAKPSQPDPSAGPPSGKNSSGMTPLMFVVKAPGKVVSTNGEVDELTGEVYWALYPEAASLKDVVLTMVCELGAK